MSRWPLVRGPHVNVGLPCARSARCISRRSQAARVADHTAFLYIGELVEYDRAGVIFTRPSDPRTEDDITGRFG